MKKELFLLQVLENVGKHIQLLGLCGNISTEDMSHNGLKERSLRKGELPERS